MCMKRMAEREKVRGAGREARKEGEFSCEEKDCKER